MNKISWDKYFVDIAEVISERSHCLSVKRGGIIVKDRQILSTGYNGPPSGYPHCEWRTDDGRYMLDNNGYPVDGFEPIFVCPRKRMNFKSGEGLEYCPASHAEANALIFAARNGVSIEGATLYCNFREVPCRECAKLIITSGISKVVLYGEQIDYPQIGIRGSDLLKQCKVEVISVEKE